MLFVGERIGSGDGPELDVALDPLEGSNIVAQGRANAMSVVAITEKGGFSGRRIPTWRRSPSAPGPRGPWI